MEKKVWLFGDRMGEYYGDNTKYLYEYILLNHCDKISAYWVTKNEKVFLTLHKQKKPVLKFDNSKDIIKIADKAFINVCYLDVANKDLLKDVDVVQLWHGTPMKQNNIAALDEQYKLVSLASIDFLFEQELGTRELFDFKLTGYPRNDILLDCKIKPYNLSSDEIKKLEEHRIIAFLPTYNEEIDPNKIGDKRGKSYDIWYQFNFDKFDKFLEDTKSIFIFKPHALQSLGKDEIYQKMSDSKNFMILDSEPFTDVYEYLKYTDILLTDYSSILFDFLLLNKPIIFTSFNLDEYIKIRDLRYPYYDITPGKKCKNWDEVYKELVNLVVNKQDNYELDRLKINHKFNYFKDSNSCKRVFLECF